MRRCLQRVGHSERGILGAGGESSIQNEALFCGLCWSRGIRDGGRRHLVDQMYGKGEAGWRGKYGHPK